MAERPQLYALWHRAGREAGATHEGQVKRYNELLREHGHVVPADHPDAGGRNLPCGWPGERAEDLDGVRLAAAEAYPDDEAQGELVVLRRAELFEFLGQVALPPWPGGGGEDLDCAPIAQRLEAWVEAHRL